MAVRRQPRWRWSASPRWRRASQPFWILPGREPSQVVALESEDRKSTRLNSSHEWISYAVFCLKKKKNDNTPDVCLVMLETNRDYGDKSGLIIGLDAAGVVSTTKASLHRLMLDTKSLGQACITP